LLALILAAIVMALSSASAQAHPGMVTIIKKTDPAGDTTQFSFHLSDTSSKVQKDFTLSDGQSITIELPKNKEYSVTERAKDGWTLTNIECVADNNDGRFSTDVPTATAHVELGEKEHKTCTFHNKPVPAPQPPPPPPPAPAPQPAPPPGVLGQSAPLPKATLSAPSKCEARSYMVTVSGSPVQTVTFFVNGRQARKVTARPDQRRFRVRLPVTRRVMHVAARVVFTAGVSPQATTLRATVRRCPKPAVRPTFTG
jgi:hypothetical protein